MGEDPIETIGILRGNLVASANKIEQQRAEVAELRGNLDQERAALRAENARLTDQLRVARLVIHSLERMADNQIYRNGNELQGLINISASAHMELERLAAFGKEVKP